MKIKKKKKKKYSCQILISDDKRNDLSSEWRDVKKWIGNDENKEKERKIDGKKYQIVKKSMNIKS